MGAAARRSSSPRKRARGSASWLSLPLFACAAVGVLQFYHPPRSLVVRPFAAGQRLAPVPAAEPSANAYGQSGEVKVRFALPSEPVDYPLEVQGDPTSLAYEWLQLDDSTSAEPARPLSGAQLVAPPKPGFYRLALVRGAEHRVVDGMTLTVLVPFSQKLGTTLNGYHIGTYIAEKLGERHDTPEGFVEVSKSAVDLPITKHLRLGDFVTHDGQDVWPRYAAVSPRLLDKLELVIAEIARLRGDTSHVQVALDVHSGFRTPSYNRNVKRSARDSRHQYGDAADVTIDANFDGRYSLIDSRLVEAAVEKVERDHPDLVGGMGLYTSRRYSTPYVHIDARGNRARWRG